MKEDTWQAFVEVAVHPSQVRSVANAASLRTLPEPLLRLGLPHSLQLNPLRSLPPWPRKAPVWVKSC